MYGELMSLAAGAAINSKASGSLSQQNLSGLVVLLPNVADIEVLRLTATLRTEQGSEVILNGVPLIALAEISDIEGGASFGLQKLLNAVGVNADEIPAAAAYVDLGYYMLSGQDELQVEITNSVALSATGGVIVGYFDAGQQLGEKPLKYTFIENDPSAVFPDAAAVYGIRLVAGVGDQEPSRAAETVCAFDIKAGNQNWRLPARMAWALTAALGRSEYGPRRTVRVHRDFQGNGALETTVVRITGSDSANYSLLAVGHVTLPGRPSVKSIEALQAVQTRVAQVSAKNPILARAARHAGRLPHLGNVARKLQVYRTSFARKRGR